MRIGQRPGFWLPFIAALAIVVSALGPGAAAAAELPTAVVPPPAGKGKPREAAPVDLAALGYVEEEFFVSGKANIYQYAASGRPVVKTPDVDYTTRILVRRPADPRRFSGVVWFETSHPQYGIDFVWSRTVDFAAANGDAVVSVAMRRGGASAIERLKAFDPVRYERINFPEEGLNWDVIAQTARLLRAKIPANPLAGYDVKRVYAQGWSGGGALLLIFIADGFHDRARMPGGRPVFDGYLVGEPSGYPRINALAQPLPADDARQKAPAMDVPAISLHTRPQEAHRRRADGDRPDDRYRVYEVAGAAHNNLRLPQVYRQGEGPLGAGCAFEVSRFPMHHVFKSTLAKLDAWAARGVTPPPSQRIALTPDGAPALDEHGNPMGGVRSTYLDVPTARYFANAPAAGGGPSCPQDGAQERFTREKLTALHQSKAAYLRRVEDRRAALVRGGWLLPADAREVQAEAARFEGF